jgi:hypothetical protein
MEHIQRLRLLFKDLLAMPYYKNCAAASGAVHNIASHEQAVEILLQQHSFTKWVPGTAKPNSETIWKWLNITYENMGKEAPVLNNNTMPDYSYLAQPCGTHDSPDFIIKTTGNIVIGIECKSADGYSPMYNSGGIKQNLIYLFCSNKSNATTMFCGKDVCSVDQQRLINELIEKQRILEGEYNGKLKQIDIHQRGISYYTRPMIQQSGGNKYTNYFTHPERGQCEENVYTYLETIVGKNI